MDFLPAELSLYQENEEHQKAVIQGGGEGKRGYLSQKRGEDVKYPGPGKEDDAIQERSCCGHKEEGDHVFLINPFFNLTDDESCQREGKGIQAEQGGKEDVLE